MSVFTIEGHAAPGLVEALERLHASGERVRLVYGNESQAYMDVGRIGRSTGERKIPLLVHNSRSMGGCGIVLAGLTRIEASAGKPRRVFWEVKRVAAPKLPEGFCFGQEQTRSQVEARLQWERWARDDAEAMGNKADVATHSIMAQAYADRLRIEFGG